MICRNKKKKFKMSKKRPTESSWDSDEELLNDTSGNAITAFPKMSELDLLGEDGELDEDALLGDETGSGKTTSVSFNSDSLWPLTRQRSKNAVSHKEQDEHHTGVDEQAFVFEEADTADLEDELNVGGQEDGSGYHGDDHYSSSMYHEGDGGDAAHRISTGDNRHGGYSTNRLTTSGGYVVSETEHSLYGGDSGSAFEDSTGEVGYIGDAGDEEHEDTSGVELGYEQPVEQDEQVHLEYDDLHSMDHHDSHEAKNAEFHSESESDDDDSRHSRGKFTSERTGVISLAPANSREAIPDTLEINEEQAAQIEQFMSDKSQKGKGKLRGHGRTSAHNRLGKKSGMGGQQHSQRHNQGPKSTPALKGLLGHSPQLRFPFSGSLANRAPFPAGLLSSRGPFPGRLMNQRGPFSGAHNQRQPFPIGPGVPGNAFAVESLNILFGGPERGPLPRLLQARFPGVPNLRGPLLSNPQQNLRGALQNPRGPPQNLRGPPQNSRGPQQNMRGPPQSLRGSQHNMRGPYPNRQQMRGPPPSQRPPDSFNQRGANQGQFGQRPPLLGQPGIRANLSRPGNFGPRNSEPRSHLRQTSPGIRFVRVMRPPAATQGNKPTMTLVKSIQNPEKSQPGQQQKPADPLMPADSPRISPHQRLGPMQGQSRFQNPGGQLQGPRFAPRMPVVGPPIMNAPVFQGNQQQPQMGAHGEGPIVRKHKIYINPRFQNQQATPVASQGRTVQMGVPTQQKRAKVLLERAIQTQNKQTLPAPAAVAGIKRKSIPSDDVPSKVVKSDANLSGKSEDAQPARVVQADRTPSDEETKKIKDLLAEQKRQRELIQKKKEIARQKQAAIKRKELESRLKEEGKTIADILGTSNTEEAKEQNQTAVPPVKQTSGPISARLGPPPQAQTAEASAKKMNPVPITVSEPPKTQQLSSNQQQFLNFQARTQTQKTSYQSQPRAATSSDPRMRGPTSNSNIRLRGQPSANNPRYLRPSTSNQFRAAHPGLDQQYRAPTPIQDQKFTGPPPSTEFGFRSPMPVSETRLAGPPPQVSMQPPTETSQAAIYRSTAPPAAQTIRFQTPHSAPPQLSGQAPLSQQFQTHYPPPSISVPQTPIHYSQPSQSQTAYVASAPQYTPQVSSYPPPDYTVPTQPQYLSQFQHPPPALPPYVQPQYTTLSQEQYQAPAASQFQTPPPQPQYQTLPAQTQYQTLPAQTQYQVPPPHPQYQSAAAQSTYQTQPTPHQYQAYTVQQYQNTDQSYNAPSTQHYQQISHDYYSEAQPIQTVSNLAQTPASVEDERTIQHQTPVGQRIQTIGQRVQPVSGSQIRSIIHNVVSQPSQTTQTASARLIQSQTAGSRKSTDGQVRVSDGPQKILIQNLPQMATKENLIKICRHFGQVLSVNMMPDQNKAVIQFQKGEQAAKCVAKCDQKCLHKTRLTVKLLPG